MVFLHNYCPDTININMIDSFPPSVCPPLQVYLSERRYTTTLRTEAGKGQISV